MWKHKFVHKGAHQQHEQQKGAQQQPPTPHLRWFPSPTDERKNFVAYWGCVTQLIGLLFFLVASVMGFLLAHFNVPRVVRLWLLDVDLLLGCMCFVAGAYLLIHSGASPSLFCII